MSIPPYGDIPPSSPGEHTGGEIQIPVDNRPINDIWHDPDYSIEQKYNILLQRSQIEDSSDLRKMIDALLLAMTNRPINDIWHDPNLTIEEKYNVLLQRSQIEDSGDLRKMIDALLLAMTQEQNRPINDIWHDPNLTIEQKYNLLLERSQIEDSSDLRKMIDALVLEMTSEANDPTKLSNQEIYNNNWLTPLQKFEALVERSVGHTDDAQLRTMIDVLLAELSKTALKAEEQDRAIEAQRKMGWPKPNLPFDNLPRPFGM